VYRILRPGGWFAASDWLMSHDGEPSDEMKAYIKAEDLDFAMASPDRYHRALQSAGFDRIELRNRNRWYHDVAQGELATLTGSDRARLEADHGAEFIADQQSTWEAMLKVLATGEHCPHHLRGQRPG
jgi:phosphoethanolamine N-methyltransferase